MLDLEKMTVDDIMVPRSEIIGIDINDDWKSILRHKLFQIDYLTTLSNQAVVSLLYHKKLDDEWRQQGGVKPEEVDWQDNGLEGKLDLVVTLDFRLSSTCLYSDIILPIHEPQSILSFYISVFTC